jgi:hypothetical protein
MKEEILKTQEEWSEYLKHTILSTEDYKKPNFQYLWHEEKITREEYERKNLILEIEILKCPVIEEYNTK